MGKEGRKQGGLTPGLSTKPVYCINKKPCKK
jgi:hypothetical protein